MILLTSTSDLLQLVTDSAAAVQVHASYMDNNGGAITPLRTNTNIAAATTTTVVGSPAASVQRNVRTLTIRNTDGALTVNVTPRHTDGTTISALYNATLLPGETLEWVEGVGWSVFTSAGIGKTAFAPPIIGAGTANLPSLRFTTGTLETSPLAGDLEYDGVVPYFTPVSAERGVINTEEWLGLTATFTLTSQTSAQKMFNTPTNGQLTVGGNRAYQFECEFDLSAMSATSGAFGFALGGTATFNSLKWWSTGNKAALATAASAQSTMNTSASNAALVTATTNTVGWAWIRGILRVNAGGTIIPQVSLGIAAAAVVGVGSFFRAWPVGNGTVTSVGNWS